MAVNGKQKGSSYERNISNLLSKRFKDVTGIEKSFRRNPDSGSFWGATNQKRISTYNTETAAFGDIICPSNFNYSIECKHYKTAPSFASLLNQNCKQWDTWLAQATQDSINSKKKMLLIIKYNNVEDFVLVSEPVDNVPVIRYRDYYIIKLNMFIDLPDTNFFTDSVTEMETVTIPNPSQI